MNWSACVLVQVFILLKQRHKKRSFKFGFNLLCFVWNLLRVVFWVLMALASNVDIPAFWLYFMWFGPHAVMYVGGHCRAGGCGVSVTTDLSCVRVQVCHVCAAGLVLREAACCGRVAAKLEAANPGHLLGDCGVGWRHHGAVDHPGCPRRQRRRRRRK